MPSLFDLQPWGRIRNMQSLNKSNSKLFFILLLALIARMAGIASRPIWYDEAFAILFSEKGPSGMLYGTLAPSGAGSSDIHPLGYYTLLWMWTNLFDSSLIAARTLSVLAGTCTIYILYRLARELFNEKTALISALFVVLAPFHIHYSQEIRMYAFLALWLVAATYAYWKGSHTDDWRWWGAFAIASALAQYTHNLAAFYLIPLALTPVFQRDWRALRATFLAGFVSVILYLPWLVQLPAQFAKVSNSYWVVKPGAERIFTLFLTYTSLLPLPNLWLIIALFSAILVITIAIWQTIRAYSQKTPMANRGLWAFYLAFCPAFLLFMFSQWIPAYIERALLPSGTLFCVWLAWAIYHTNLSKIGRGLLSAMLAITFAAGIYQHLTYRGFPYGPFREMTIYLRDHAKPGDTIIHSNKLSMLPSMYFDRDLAQSFIGDPPGSATDTLAPATQQVLGIKAEADISTAVEDADRVWYIIYQRSIDEYVQAGRHTHPDIDYLNSIFTLKTHESWDELRILLYTKDP